ncbi:hypothetical protein H4R33_004769 [Dimargaris cristalligena]|nr:hypothetical protein H4R33_004769 [Dimargaris cristalligena]
MSSHHDSTANKQQSSEYFNIGDKVMFHLNDQDRSMKKGTVMDIAIQSAFEGQTKPGHPERWNQEHHRFMVKDESGNEHVLKRECIDKRA